MYITESERIGLRKLKVEDAEITFKIIKDSNIPYYTRISPEHTLEKEINFIKKWDENIASGKEFVFGIIEKKSNKLIGTSVLAEVNKTNHSSEFGLWIGKESWGKGYGVETTKLMLKYGFEKLKLHSIHAGAYSFNERSINLMKKSGMKQVGRYRERINRDNKYYDYLVFDILKSEFK
ncbi:GNAT family N-acetyltransferase [Candidatus Micrarchaeota archaeon]|nr:GNAT family N-acetyltransferase [Candidatus Micrarchaeota archaeon]